MNLNKLFEKFLKTIEDDIKYRTLFNYKQIFRLYLSEFGEKKVKELDAKTLDKYFNSLKKSLSLFTVKMIKGLMQRLLNFAYYNKIINTPILLTQNIKLARGQKIKCLKLNEQRKLERHILQKKDVYKYGILFALHTGMRLGEIAALRWSNVDFEFKKVLISTTRGEVYTPKFMEIEGAPKTTESLREIPLTKTAFDILKELKAKNLNSDYVFVNKNGVKMCIRGYQACFSRLLNRLNIPHYNFHALRHTFATRCLEVGIDIKTISELLGHANTSITLNFYVHTNFDKKRKALKMLERKFQKTK